jgi:hypothetical protein
MNCTVLLPFIYLLVVCYSFPQNLSPSTFQLPEAGFTEPTAVTFSASGNVLRLGDRKQLIYPKTGKKLPA